MYPILSNRKFAIITGGSSGIGKATALLLAREEAHIAIIARRVDVLERARQEIAAMTVDSDQQIIAISADVSDRSQIERAIQQVIAAIGAPDLLITSAGIAKPGYFQEIPLEVFAETMAINYFGTLYTIKAVLPAMMEQKRGRIVIISSAVGLVGIYGYTSYSPTKFALRGLTESLRGELKCFGIDTSIVYPPDTETPQLVAENLTKPRETKLISAIAQTWSAEGVGQVILRGIQRKEFAITPGWDMKFLNASHSVLAPLLNVYADFLVKKARK